MPCKSSDVFIHCTGCDKALDLVIVADIAGPNSQSGSDDWNSMRSSIVDFVSRFRIGLSDTIVAMVTYSDSGNIQWFLSDGTSQDIVQDGIRNIEFSAINEVNLANGLTKVIDNVLNTNNGNRGNVDNIVVIFTDQDETMNEALLLSEADYLQGRATVFAVLVTNQPDVQQFEDRITNGPDYVTSVSSFSDLNNHLSDMTLDVCDGPSGGSGGSTPPSGGGTPSGSGGDDSGE